MRLIDVPKSPAYLVSHDPYANGAMDVWPMESLEIAQREATRKNKFAEESGADECATWKAYEKLPRIRIWKFHASEVPA